MKRLMMTLVLLLASASRGHAQQYIDRQQTLATILHYTTISQYAGERITQSTGVISGGGFYLFNSEELGNPERTGSFLIGLYNGLPYPSTPLVPIASAVVDYTLAAQRGAWFDGFWSPVTATTGVLLMWRTSGEGDVRLSTTSGFDNAGLQPDYSLFLTGQGTGSDEWNASNRLRFAFRTWTTVSEPSSCLLLGSGLCVMAVGFRRRRAPTRS